MNKIQQVSIRNLRAHTKEIIDAVKRGTEIEVASRGKSCVKIIPIKKLVMEKEDDAFGMWADRKEMNDVSKYINTLRKGRFYAR